MEFVKSSEICGHIFDRRFVLHLKVMAEGSVLFIAKDLECRIKCKIFLGCLLLISQPSQWRKGKVIQQLFTLLSPPTLRV